MIDRVDEDLAGFKMQFDVTTLCAIFFFGALSLFNLSDRHTALAMSYLGIAHQHFALLPTMTEQQDRQQGLARCALIGAVTFTDMRYALGLLAAGAKPMLGLSDETIYTIHPEWSALKAPLRSSDVQSSLFVCRGALAASEDDEQRVIWGSVLKTLFWVGILHAGRSLTRSYDSGRTEDYIAVLVEVVGTLDLLLAYAIDALGEDADAAGQSAFFETRPPAPGTPTDVVKLARTEIGAAIAALCVQLRGGI